jgi:hypothetical protein
MNLFSVIDAFRTGVPTAVVVAGLLLCFPACRPTVLAVETGERRALDPYGIGVNGNLTGFDQPWEDERLLAAFRDLGVRHLRYPAGTLGNYWDWDTGWLDQTVPDSLMLTWVVEQKLKESPNRYTLENLARMTERTGAVPIFMLNMLSKDLDHSLRNLRRARDLGLPVRYVELSNELYFNVPFPMLGFPTPEDYGRTSEEWIGVLSAEFPEARFAVVGSHLAIHPRQQNWTRRVLAHCPSADAVTYHTYAPSGLDGRRSRRNLEPGKEGLGNPYTATRRGPRDVRQRQAWERAQLGDPAAYANLLTTARENARKYRQAGVPEGMEIWATEFNMRDDSSLVRGSWAQCMLLSVYYGEFLDSPITVTTIHNLVGSLFGLLYTESGQLDYLLDRPREVQAYAPSAAGVVTGLFAAATERAGHCVPLYYREAPKLVDDRGEPFGSVRGYWMQGETDGALLVNYGLRSVTVAVPDALASGAAYTYRAPLDRTIVGLADVDHTTTDIYNGRVTLPPTSITHLTAAP